MSAGGAIAVFIMGRHLLEKRMNEICFCGHVLDEHGSSNDKEFPSELACLVENCECIHYEHNPQAVETDE